MIRFRRMTLNVNMLPIARGLAMGVAAIALAGCSSFGNDKVDYKTAKQGNALEVPPDLTQISNDTAFQSSGTVKASQFNARVGESNVPTAANSVGDVRIERAGTERWLVVKRDAGALWDPLEAFWQDSGFLLNVNRKDIGVMETDWAENRAKLPLDFIRESLGKLLDTLYSTGELDKFRTRIERNAAGETEIYVTHRGMIEVYTGGANQDTRWQPRPADAELENEFLRRIMLRLGASESEAAQAVEQTAAVPKAQLKSTADGASVTLAENPERAWRRVGLALDRTGFTVEDRDKTKGVYFVRYADDAGTEDPGFFSKLFGAKKKEIEALQYRIGLDRQPTLTTVSVTNSAGDAVTPELAKRILSVIAADLQ